MKLLYLLVGAILLVLMHDVDVSATEIQMFRRAIRTHQMITHQLSRLRGLRRRISFLNIVTGASNAKARVYALKDAMHNAWADANDILADSTALISQPVLFIANLEHQDTMFHLLRQRVSNFIAMLRSDAAAVNIVVLDLMKWARNQSSCAPMVTEMGAIDMQLPVMEAMAIEGKNVLLSGSGLIISDAMMNLHPCMTAALG